MVGTMVERCVEDVLAEGLRSRKAGARASVLATVVAFATTRVVAAAGPPPRIATDRPTGIEGVTRVTVAAETLMYRDRGA